MSIAGTVTMEKTLKVTCQAAATLPLDKLVPLQGNLKVLSVREFEKLQASLLQYGISFPFLAWKQNGTTYILDGHQRDTVLRKMREQGWKIPPVPVAYVQAKSKKEAMEKILLISSKYGQITHEGLLEFVALGDIKLPDLKNYIHIPELDLDKEFKTIAKEDNTKIPGEKSDVDKEDARIEAESVLEFNPFAILPSSNKLGIPDLREDMLSTQVPQKTFHYRTPEDIPDREHFKAQEYMFLFGRVRSSVLPYARGGVLGFYVWDNVFEKIWDNAVTMIAKIKEEGWGSVITPNFSVWRNDPLVVQMWQIYRNRWFARYWQEAGIKIIPDINWGDERSYDFCFHGLPKKIPVASMVCQRMTDKDNEDSHKLLPKHLTTFFRNHEVGTMILYGEGGSLDRLKGMLPVGPKYVFLQSWMAARKTEVIDKAGDTHMYQQAGKRSKKRVNPRKED
jgi:hypothetical protein